MIVIILYYICQVVIKGGTLALVLYLIYLMWEVFHD